MCTPPNLLGTNKRWTEFLCTTPRKIHTLPLAASCARGRQGIGAVATNDLAPELRENLLSHNVGIGRLPRR